MEKEQKEKVSPLILFKSRGYAGCIADAYRLFTDNLGSIMRHVWLPMLIFAILIAAAITAMQQGSKMEMVGVSTNNVEALQKGGIIVLAGLVMLLLSIVPMNIMYGRYFTMLRQHSLTDKMPMKKEKLPKADVRKMVRRVWAAFFVYLIIFGILIAAFCAPIVLGCNEIPTDPSNYKFYGIAALIALVGFIFILPLYNVYMAYMIDHSKGLFATFANQFGRSFKHWGFLFIIFVITALILLMIFAVLSLPEIILTTADNTNTLGMMQGDPDGLPSSFPLIMIVTTALITFASYCIYLLVYTIMYYAYGSIETQEKEKAKRMK